MPDGSGLTVLLFPQLECRGKRGHYSSAGRISKLVTETADFVWYNKGVMIPSRENNEKRSVFDVQASKPRRVSRDFWKRLLYGKNVLNLRPNLRHRRPWVVLAIVIFTIG